MNYYFAGALFSHKDLIGNRLLADAVDRVSSGRWQALLPQNEENQLRPDALEIRDNDLAMVLEADAALFNFDGSELDSGTVAEFMMARFLDLPCVLFRTDFRSAGDQNADGEPWNLMLSGYPRTVTLRFDAMSRYQEHFTTLPPATALENYYREMAEMVTGALDEVYRTPRLLSGPEERQRAFEQAVRLCGGTLPQRFTPEVIAGLPGVR